MAITKEKKVEMVADYVEKLSKSQAVILTDYRGVSVSDVTDLRGRLREVDSTYQVVKNSLFRRALDEAGLSLPEDQFEGPIAVGYCFDEVPPVAKALTDFAKEVAAVQVRGAIMDNDFVDKAGVKALADLPPREILLGALLGAVQGPMSGLASTVIAPMRELVQVLQARSEQDQQAAA